MLRGLSSFAFNQHLCMYCDHSNPVSIKFQQNKPQD